eukprot:3313060-Alexandrium_andersonii.AAC.1
MNDVLARNFGAASWRRRATRGGSVTHGVVALKRPKVPVWFKPGQFDKNCSRGAAVARAGFSQRAAAKQPETSLSGTSPSAGSGRPSATPSLSLNTW